MDIQSLFFLSLTLSVFSNFGGVVKVNSQQTDLDQVVDDYDTIPNIGLNNPEEGGPFHAQELAQGPCSCREELGPVAQDPDLADDIACPGRANQLQITRTKINRSSDALRKRSSGSERMRHGTTN